MTSEELILHRLFFLDFSVLSEAQEAPLSTYVLQKRFVSSFLLLCPTENNDRLFPYDMAVWNDMRVSN